MAYKEVNVNLRFTADTKQAAAQLQNLQQQLTHLVNQPVSIGDKLTDDMVKASHAAADLKVHLQNATNVKTGTLDFGKLNQSLKKSKVTLGQYATQLQSLGPQGQQAFMQLARSVANAEIPLRRSNALLQKFSKSLASTAGWQISSTILHGFIGAVSTAWEYSKELNESLNNIRIVTGKNIDEMSRFADQANRAAKALSTTTIEYTNASLIYYQQGLSDEEVLGRTEATIKLANVSRQSAEIVSDQMTAIWNNFYDGSKTLEYYADVVTALGAATASSSEEIAQGLEKFAAVADTVGLSYEYATSALATVTATTRQSADVVGTAFKTLFARIQDLELGETLDDGTTLGQYSEALMKVGIDIKDNAGALKDMDVILEEMGAKWKEIDKDQQVALAKSVAGIRQYTQLIALMDNWDFMQKNLAVATSSSGTLEEQAKIYAESWEAASNRVQASLERLYSSLIDDEFFIDLTDGFASLIDGVGTFVKSIGGLSGVLTTLGFIVTKVFSQQMAQGFENLFYNIQMSSKAGRKALQDLKKQEMQGFIDSMTGSQDYVGETGKNQKKIYTEELQMQTELIEKANQLTAAEQKKYQILLEQHRVMGEQSIKLSEQLELSKSKISDNRLNILGTVRLNDVSGKVSNEDITAQLNEAKKTAEAMSEVDLAIRRVGSSSEVTQQQINDIVSALELIKADDLKGLVEVLAGGTSEAENVQLAISKIRDRMNEITANTSTKVAEALIPEGTTEEINELSGTVTEYISNTRTATTQNKDLKASMDANKTAADKFGEALQKTGKKSKTTGELLSTMTSSLMSVGMLVSSISGLMNTIEDPDASGWEKFGSVLTSVSMIAMSFSGVIKGLQAGYELFNTGVLKNTAISIANALANRANEKALEKQNKANVENKIVTDAANESTKKAIVLNTTEAASHKAVKESLEGENAEKIKGKIIDETTSNTDTPSVGSGGGGAKLQPGALKAVGKYAAGAAALAAAVAVVATTITWAINDFNRFETAARDAATAAEMATEAYNNARSAYDNFVSTSSEYNNIIESMKEMTKNTVEYTEAMMKANDEALKLIENYEGLQYTIKDGVITIDQESLKIAQQKELEKVSKAQSSQLLANVAAKQARGEADKAKVTRDLETTRDNYYTGVNTAAGAGAGAGAGFLGTVGVSTMIGSTAGLAGMAIGALAGLIIGGIGALIATETTGVADETEGKAIDKLVEYVRKNGTDIFAAKTSEEFGQMLKDAKLEIKDQELVKALFDNSKSVDDNTESLKDFVIEEAARGKSADEQWKLAYGAFLTGNAIYDKAASQMFLQNEALKYKDENPELTKSITEDVNDLFDGSNDDFWKAYMEEVLGDTNVDEDSTTGDKYKMEDLGGSYVTMKMKNVQGVYETVGSEDGLSEEVAKQQLINARIMKKVAENLGGDNQRLNALVDQLKRAGVEDTTMANDILEAFSDKDGKAIDLSKFTPELIEQITTSAITDSGLKDKVEKALEDYKKKLPEWWDQLSKEEQSMLFEIGIDKEQSLNEAKDAIDRMQRYLDGQSLIAKIEIQDQLKAALRNGDWEKLEELFKGEKGPGADKWVEFLSLGSVDKMEQWLNTYSAEDLKGELNSLPGRVEQSKKDYKTETSELEGTNKELNYQKEVVLDEKKSDYTEALSEYDDFQEARPQMIKNKKTEIYNRVASGNDSGWTQGVSANSFIQGLSNFSSGSAAVNIADLLELTQIMQGGTGFSGVLQSGRTVTTSGNQHKLVYDDIFIELIQQLSGRIFQGKSLSDIRQLATNEANNGNSRLKNIIQDIDSLMQSDLLDSNIDNTALFQDFFTKYIVTPEIVKYQAGLNVEQYGLNQAINSAHSDVVAQEGVVTELENQKEGQEGVVSDATDAYTENLIALTKLNQAFDNESKRLGLDVDVVNTYKENFKTLTETEKALYGISDAFENNETAIREAAKEMGRFDKAIELVASNYSEWMKILSSNDLRQQAKIANELDSAYSHLLDIEQNILSFDFLRDVENLVLMQEAVKGNKTSFNQLQIKGVEDIFQSNDLEISEEVKQAIVNAANSDLEIGESISDEVIAKISSGFSGSGLTELEEDQLMQQILSLLGFQEIDNKYIKTTEGLGASEALYENLLNSNTTKTKDLQKDKTDIVERYKEINDQLENTNNLMSKNSTLIEGLYGEARFKKMRENIKLMEQENKQLETKLVLANDYLAEDKKALDDAAGEAGIWFNIDNNGNIINYTTAMEKLHNQRENLLKEFDETTDSEEQKRLDELDKKIEKVTSAYQKYETTLNEKAEIEQSSLDKLLQVQEEYYNLLNEEIELKISINEDDMSLIDYYLDKIADDFYQMAEAAAILFSSDSSALGINQLDIYRSNLKIQKEAIKQLEYDRNTINPATGQTYINEAKYQEELRDAKQSILDNLSSLNELDKQMLNYYGDTLAMAGEELVKYTSRMEHQSSVLEHYQSILELTGKKTNYKALGAVLESQAEASENSMRIAKESLDMYTKLADEQYAKHQQAVNNSNEAAADLYLKQYEAALEAANQAEEEYLSKAKEWGEKLKLVLENTMNDLARDLENTLTGGTSFDQMVTSMERAESLQEEYLTTTNKIYETNKLMNQVQQEIDKSTNSVAKRRMKQFIEETKQLQDQSKLSQYELDIQKAKYDLLLAEIALEEAQSTKSTVRLQRDSEGNFGYVYTADSNAISAAEQELADKQNALYNIGLEGANDYSNKYKQTMNEMYDDITEIQKQKLEGIFETEEEYQNAMAATKEYYYNKLKQYSSLYSIALTTDSAVVTDAWSSDFNNMIYKTDEWEQAVNKYIDSVQISLQDYEKKMDSLANDTVGKDLDTIAEKTDNITEANDKLVDKITNPENGVLKAIEDQMKSVEDLSGKYSNLRKEIEELISDYERLIGINKDGNENSSSGIQLPTSNTNTNTNNSLNNNSNNSSNNNSSSQTSSGVKSYQTGILSWTGDGANRVWKDSSGNTYAYGSPEQKAIQRAFNKAFEDHGYSDVYMKGWRNLNADFLHKKYGLSTGGYTGDWAGSYGKLAFLHQKELILNKDDTKNFLSSIEVIERILDTIDLHAMNSQLSGILQSPGFIQPQETTIEQNVKIEASFPNVTNHNEIEEAFNDIINMASQYANRK